MMDNQSQNSRDLAVQIKASLAKPQHRFELRDPLAAKEERRGTEFNAGTRDPGVAASDLNTIAPDFESRRRGSAAATAARPATDSPGNKVESDEVFTATQGEGKSVVPSDIEYQYRRVGDKFYHPKNPNLLAFEDKGNKLETKSNSEAIAESMVRIAQARGWDEIKVSGSEVFRKEAWLEAASRGMHVKGYSPSAQDLAELAKRTPTIAAHQAALSHSDTQLARVFASDTPADAVRKHPELAGAFASVAAMTLKAEADGVTPDQRVVVAARVRQNVINSIERGTLPQVRIKDEAVVQCDILQDKEYAR